MGFWILTNMVYLIQYKDVLQGIYITEGIVVCLCVVYNSPLISMMVISL